jgi:hypothetical protein
VLIAVAIVGFIALLILGWLIGVMLREEEEVDRGRPRRRRPRG